MIKIFGLKNCDVTQKKIKELKQQAKAFELIDFKEHPATANQIEKWCRQTGWQKLLNKRSTTWKSLDKITQDSVVDEASAIKLMAEYNNLIKRPVVENGL